MNNIHEPKFTPGPWKRVKSYRDTYIVDKHERSILLVLVADDLDTAANGDLATAAPTMYAALEAAMAFDYHRDTCTHCRANGLCRDGNDLLGASLELSKAALSQARGQEGETR